LINNFNNLIDHYATVAEDGGFDLPSPRQLAETRRDLLSQAEMADLLGADPSQVSRFERGKGGMSYDRIRRYAQVLNLRMAASDAYGYLRDRIEDRGPLPELRLSDRLGRALEGMTGSRVGQLPVLDDEGTPLGVLTEVAVCQALAETDPEAALARPVEDLPLEPLDAVRPGDSVTRAAALLASHWLVRLVDEEGATAGYATRRDLFPLVLGGGED
jgi:predicted transcriptional regulator